MDEKNRGFGWLAPTPRLLLFIVLSLLFTLSSQWIPVLLALGVALLLLIFGGKYPRAALIACASAFVLTFLGNALFASENIRYSWWVFNISDASLQDGLRLGLRLMAMILVAIAFIAVTPNHELLQAFRGLKIPATAEMYLTIVLRYVDVLWYDIQVSMKAMAVRGVDWEGSFREKIPAFSRLMLPLIFRILDHIDGQSLAIDNRGGISARRTDFKVDPLLPAVSMKDVYVRFGNDDEDEGAHAIKDMNLEIAQGEATVLVGPIGAGKTSTLLLCTGLVPYSVGRMRGDVEIFGRNSKEATQSELGYMARIVFPSAVQGLVGLTVKDELVFSLRMSTLDEEKYDEVISEALQIVGLDDSFLPRLTLGLSGGEMQRVALASAIVAHPHLLALDDVTVQLDPVGKREVIAAVRALLKGRITTVMCDPHVELLTDVGDRFISLQNGQITGAHSTLDASTIKQASLRMPQLLQLSQNLGIELPADVASASAALRPQATRKLVFDDAPSAADQPIIVQAQGISYQYPKGPKAIDALDVTFRKGEFIALLGSNGSGKTTLALTLAGALTPTEGQILIEGEEFKQHRHKGMIGYVFQEPVNQIVTMKVSDELAFGPQQLQWNKTAVADVVNRELERFDLHGDDVPLHLAPADARKLAIAGTLSMNPRLIILDEPTNNLDDAETRHLMAHLQKLKAEGTTVLLITHDVDVAAENADRMIVMSKGQILADDSTRQVMARPEMLIQSDVVPPPIIELSLALWPDALPALTVDELANCFEEAVLVSA